MKKLLFAAAYAATVLLPGILYLAPLGGLILALQDPYGLSVLLGSAAFAVLSNQFFLAARPAQAVAALGLKPLLAFHGTMATVGLLLAASHLTLKALILGYPTNTLQAGLGVAAFALFLAAILSAAFLMANTFWMKIPALKRFKEWKYRKLGLTYQKMRAVHNATVAAGILVLLHVLLASSSDFFANPAASAWALLWSLFCLGAYLRYRLRGRAGGAVKAGR